MFGAPIAQLYEYVLGIRQQKDTSGYKDISIAPSTECGLSHVKGYIEVRGERVEVEYVCESGNMSLRACVPQTVERATLILPGVTKVIRGGESTVLTCKSQKL